MIQLTEKEANFLLTQLACRKDYFQLEMTRGVRDVERLKQLNFIMDTLDKGMALFSSQL